jgi:hypothetical protein
MDVSRPASTRCNFLNHEVVIEELFSDERELTLFLSLKSENLETDSECFSLSGIFNYKCVDLFRLSRQSGC